MKFKGNFGVLTLQIIGTTAIGNYQRNGKLSGDFTNDTFKGKWENKGLEGLIEFTIKENNLEGNWKKGLDPGPMKGKWKGEIITDNDEENEDLNHFNVECLKEAFPEAHEFTVRINTDHWMLIEDGWQPEAAYFSYTVNKKGELLSWNCYSDEVIPYLEIPEHWHEQKWIFSGTIDTGELAEEIEEHPMNDMEAFYELCCEILEYIKEQ